MVILQDTTVFTYDGRLVECTKTIAFESQVYWCLIGPLARIINILTWWFLDFLELLKMLLRSLNNRVLQLSLEVQLPSLISGCVWHKNVESCSLQMAVFKNISFCTELKITVFRYRNYNGTSVHLVYIFANKFSLRKFLRHYIGLFKCNIIVNTT